MLEAPLVKAYVLQLPAESLLRQRGFDHPMGDDWRGIQDIDPGKLTRERHPRPARARSTPNAILAVVPHGTPQEVAQIVKGYCRRRPAGAEDPRLQRHGGTEVRRRAPPQKVREAEDELLRLVEAEREQNADILDADALLDAGRGARPGSADYGDDTLAGRFGSWRSTMLRAAAWTRPAERAAADVCHWLLTSRLEFFEDRKRYPIAEEKIERPVFATGEPRSGTTLLHALLSVDPNGRALRFWEVMYPSPPPGLAGAGRSAPRHGRRRLARDPRQASRTGWSAIPTTTCWATACRSASGPGRFDFRVLTPTAWWRVPMGMNIGGLPADPRAQYRLHKMMLQHCQYARPEEVLGAEGLSRRAGCEALFDTYPDARIIWVHRDPVQVIASRIVLCGRARRGPGRPASTGRTYAAHAPGRCAAQSFQRRPEQSARSTIRASIMSATATSCADPVGTIRGFYEKYGVPFTPGDRGGDARLSGATTAATATASSTTRPTSSARTSRRCTPSSRRTASASASRSSSASS